MNYQRSAFYWYTYKVAAEMTRRNIKFQRKFLDEIQEFCLNNQGNAIFSYPEHNNRYFMQCYYNLQEKFDRGIISEEDFKKIKNIII